jgi:hypothetical protein
MNFKTKRCEWHGAREELIYQIHSLFRNLVVNGSQFLLTQLFNWDTPNKSSKDRHAGQMIVDQKAEKHSIFHNQFKHTSQEILAKIF